MDQEAQMLNLNNQTQSHQINHSAQFAQPPSSRRAHSSNPNPNNSYIGRPPAVNQDSFDNASFVINRENSNRSAQLTTDHN